MWMIFVFLEIFWNMVCLLFMLLWNWFIEVSFMVLFSLIVFEFGFFILFSILNRVDLLVLFGLMMLIIVFFGMLKERLLIRIWLLNDLVRFFILIILLFRCLLGGMNSLLVLLCFWCLVFCSFLKCVICVFDLVWWFFGFWWIYFSFFLMVFWCVFFWEVFCFRWVFFCFSYEV